MYSVDFYCYILIDVGSRDELKIVSAMHEWERMTCLRFRPKNFQDANYIHIVDGPG